MKSLVEYELQPYETIMRYEGDRNSQKDEDEFCRYCLYLRRKWKYRYCYHLECPYIKGLLPFRKETFEM